MDTPENQLEAAAQELARYANLSITEAREHIRQIQTHFQPRVIQPITIWPQTINRITK